MADYREVRACRLCDGTRLASALDLGHTPLANELGGHELFPLDELFPLEVMRCEACGHHQLSIAIRPERLWGPNYPYQSGTSPVFLAHLEKLANEVAKLYPAGYVLEIASNDGSLVDMLNARGLTAFGIDPSGPDETMNRGLVQAAWPDPGYMLLQGTKGEERPHDCIIALNVMAHVDDLRGFTAAMKRALRPGGLIVIEVGYLGGPTTGARIFDTIYHEHFSYHDLASLGPFFARHDLAIEKFSFNESQGRTLRLYVRHAGETRETGPREWIEWRMDFSGMHQAIENRGAALRESLGKLAKRGEKIAGFGCPAKLTTMMYATGLRDACAWDCIFDDNPLKIGKTTPGTRIPIVSTTELLERAPDTLVIFSWNFYDEIRQRVREMGYRGGLINPMGGMS